MYRTAYGNHGVVEYYSANLFCRCMSGVRAKARYEFDLILLKFDCIVIIYDFFNRVYVLIYEETATM